MEHYSDKGFRQTANGIPPIIYMPFKKPMARWTIQASLRPTCMFHQGPTRENTITCRLTRAILGLATAVPVAAGFTLSVAVGPPGEPRCPGIHARRKGTCPRGPELWDGFRVPGIVMIYLLGFRHDPRFLQQHHHIHITAS